MSLVRDRGRSISRLAVLAFGAGGKSSLTLLIREDSPIILKFGDVLDVENRLRRSAASRTAIVVPLHKSRVPSDDLLLYVAFSADEKSCSADS